MTREQFVDKIESYYGNELPATAKMMTIGYLKDFKEKKLGTLLQIVLKYHPINYGCPAIATIEQAHKDYNLGDERKKIDGHTSLKKKNTVSATRPIEEEIDPDDLISDEEAREIFAQIGKNKA